MHRHPMVVGNLALKGQDIALTQDFVVVDGGLSVRARVPQHAAMSISTLALVLCILVGIAVQGSLAQRHLESALRLTPQTSIVVQSGDTLWDIASRYKIDGVNTQDTVDIIRSWNHLSSASLQIGSTLLVPAS